MAVLFPLCAMACIWDADTLSDEKKSSPRIAEVILGPAPSAPDAGPLRERIRALHAQPRENDPAWWNDLAGAHLRLGEAAEAAKLLEPLVSRFTNDYGIHANLGTAYHLLGRYADAERHIARDLEINPDAHFGLEKYHLALLRYLNRDSSFQKEHVYLEAWSRSFFEEASHPFAYRSLDSGATNGFDELFVGATNLLEGAMYMAQLNQQQPACWVMLGVLCQEDPPAAHLNLAKAAFERAIQLGTPQKETLTTRIDAIDRHISEAHSHRGSKVSPKALLSFAGSLLVFLLIPIAGFLLWWRSRRRRIQGPK